MTVTGRAARLDRPWSRTGTTGGAIPPAWSDRKQRYE
jgi:hypothetical protein